MTLRARIHRLERTLRPERRLHIIELPARRRRLLGPPTMQGKGVSLYPRPPDCPLVPAARHLTRGPTNPLAPETIRVEQ